MSSSQGIIFGIALFLITSVNGMYDTSGYDLSDVKERIRYYCDVLVRAKAPYTWGGYWLNLGGDCSGQTAAIYRISGVGVKRENAIGMWLGRGGWGIDNHDGFPALAQDAYFPNLVFFSYKKKADHVGVYKGIFDEDYWFYEASSSAKIFKETTLVQGNRFKSVLGYKIVPLGG